MEIFILRCFLLWNTKS